METITLEQLEKVAKDLESKFSFIPDFKLHVYTHGVIQGGFYWMEFLNTGSKYAFHETFLKPTEEHHTPEWLFNYASEKIIRQLNWQKESDENYAKEFEKEVKYKYDYSKIPS